MTKKHTKSAVFTSVMALILCFAMLVGTTFAWFTDSVTSGNNKINAGNLDVELYHSDKDDSGYVADDTVLFNDVTLWEPGVVAYENFRVENQGNLALKYQLALTFKNAAVSPKTNKTLADVLKVAVVKGGFNGTTRADAEGLSYTPLSTFVLNGIQTGELESNQKSETYGIVIYWEPSDSDNDFNMNNEHNALRTDATTPTTLTIDLAVQLDATQLQYEKDSFDEKYDADLELPEIKIETPTAEALLAALAEGKTAVLPDNMTLESDIAVPAGVTSGINLNGKTLTLGKGGIAVNGNLVVANGTVSVVNGESDLNPAFAVSNGGILDIESDAVINVTEDKATGIYMAGGALNVDGNINVNGGASGVHVMDGNADITVAGAINATSGYAINQQGQTTNVEVTGTITGTSMLGSAGTMNLTYVGEQPVVEGDGTATTLNAQQFIADGVTKNGNTYYISNANGLNWFAAQANGTMSRAASSEDTFSGKTVVLTQDINLSGAGWTPITKFAGTFDGQNHTISNFNINGNSCVAFFGQISGATIKNVTFDNVTVSGNHYVGVIFGWEGAESIWSYVTNCHVTNATVACTVVDNDNGDKVGGIGGYAVTTTIEGCSVNNIKISAYRDAGGILGYANNKTVVKNNSASGVSLHWDNSVNYKNYTTVSEADLNTHVGEAASSANVNEGNTGDSKSSISSSNVTDIDKVLKDKGDVVLTDDVTTSANDTTANSGYGATGVQVNGGVLDGKGKTLTVNDANSTWDCAVNTTGGTIKNLTVAGAMRGIFMGGATADVYIDNVIFKDVVYTFNSDGGNNNYGVYISNSTLNGWTSFSNVHKEVVFTNCDFGEGSGYAFCRPYNVTTFTDCDFAEGFEIDARNTIVFENCTIGGVALTAENLATLVTSNIANATVK